ncbi:hypothetical protein DFH11DRAFT_1542717 [Phellopilus nigrolimitatus]|nr:hypothetical protein DFH11DRAFT_1542717 [Phellopilus nigrolimitatus]
MCSRRGAFGGIGQRHNEDRDVDLFNALSMNCWLGWEAFAEANSLEHFKSGQTDTRPRIVERHCPRNAKHEDDLALQKAHIDELLEHLPHACAQGERLQHLQTRGTVFIEHGCGQRAAEFLAEARDAQGVGNGRRQWCRLWSCLRASRDRSRYACLVDISTGARAVREARREGRGQKFGLGEALVLEVWQSNLFELGRVQHKDGEEAVRRDDVENEVSRSMIWRAKTSLAMKSRRALFVRQTPMERLFTPSATTEQILVVAHGKQHPPGVVHSSAGSTPRRAD